ncbi:MAG: hypothetical protein K6T83_19065 [Alicyclobacillus sp.]|nr:hypothetical protein [Alicyclobacillus sp.]
MGLQRCAWNGRTKLAVTSAGLAAIYGLLVGGWNIQPSQLAFAHFDADLAWAYSNAQGNVPDAVVRHIADGVGAVPGVELVVLPSSRGDGYVVFATVDLGTNPAGPPAEWSTVVKRDMNTFFRGIYTSGEPVEDAAVYFMIGQQTVAGAGLGRTSFEQLASAASTNTGGLVAALIQAPQRTVGGPEDQWIQVASNAVAP